MLHLCNTFLKNYRVAALLDGSRQKGHPPPSLYERAIPHCCILLGYGLQEQM